MSHEYLIDKMSFESPCTSTLTRRYTGLRVRELFEKDGVEVTEPLVSIIDVLLTEYDVNIFRGVDEKLVNEIYSKAKERYNMKLKSQT